MPSTSFIASHNVYDALFAADDMSDAATDADSVSVVTVDSDAFRAESSPPSVTTVPTRSTRDERMKAKLREGIKTVFVHRLPPQTTVEELRAVFASYGRITEIYIPQFKDPTQPNFGMNKSYAFIKFASTEDALLAFRSLFERLVLRGIRVRVTLSTNDQ
jgi:RNA recognition motif-containing protein